MKTKEIILTVHRVEPEETFDIKDFFAVLGSFACLLIFTFSFYIIFYFVG